MPHSVIGKIICSMLLMVPLVARGFPADETHVEGSPDFATALAADSEGNIWIGSEDQGVMCLTPTGGVKTFTTANGLGDDGAYAIAVDHRQRVWVGHHNHGVSVFNGRDWKNYTAINGPISEHVYAIGVSPKDDDVWIATDAGLSRWSQKGDNWTYFTRAEGLPADQIRGIAFDSDGDMYLASACAGVIIGRAADDFAKWEQVKGPDEMPLTARGKGLPTNLTNAVCVTKTNAIWVATTRGVAMSDDKGKNWKYTRGSDWQEMAEGSYAGIPPGFKLTGQTEIAEDYVNTVSTDPSGDVWVGFRGKGWERLRGKAWPIEAVFWQSDALPEKDKNDEITAVLTSTGSNAYVARYGQGVWRCDKAAGAIEGPPLVDAPSAALPKPAAAPTVEALVKMKERIAKAGKSGVVAAYLGEDWSTQGDWLGRYGRQCGTLSGAGWGSRTFGEVQNFRVEYAVGPHHPNSGVYSYTESYKAKSRNVLWDPLSNSRTQAEHNDGSFNLRAYPFVVEGPDLWIGVTVPEGVHRVSLYFYNVDGHKGQSAWRDFPLELRRAPAVVAVSPNVEADDDEPVQRGRQAAEKYFALEKQPVLARGRVTRFTSGVYEQFVVSGKGQYWIKIVRNHSFCTKIQGVFVDQLTPDRGREGQRISTNFAGVEWPAPVMAVAKDKATPAEVAARNLWGALDAGWENEGIENYSYVGRMMAYRAVAEQGLASLEAWRWPLHIWTTGDRETFDAKMAEGRRKFIQLNPQRENQ